MKKGLFIFLISIFVVLALTGENPVKADDLIPSDVITVTPALSPTELKEKVTTSFLIEYLRQGGSIDLTNKDPNYGVDDFINNFSNLIEEIVQPLDEFNVIYNPFDTGTRVNPTAMCYNGVKLFTDMLPSISQDNSTPTPVIPDDFSYLQHINDMYVYNYETSNTDYYYFGNFDNAFNPANGTNFTYNTRAYTYQSSTVIHQPTSGTAGYSTVYYNYYPLMSIYVYTNRTPNKIDIVYSNSNTSPIVPNTSEVGAKFIRDYYSRYGFQNTVLKQNQTGNYNQSQFNTLSDALSYIYQHYCNINLYVDDSPYAIVSEPNFYVGLGQGTFIEGTNYPVEYTYQIDIFIDYDDILDRLDTLIDNQNKISFPDFSDLIVDANGQPAFAIVDVTPQDNIDDWYVKNYGTLIPLFPVFVSYPVSVDDIANVATIGIVDVIPDDLLEIFGIALIGMLFVTFIHRLLE